MTRGIRRPAGLAMVVCAFALTAPAAQGASLGAGCAPGRPAVAHHAGGKGVAAPPKRVPGATETGFYTGGTWVVGPPDGTGWFSCAASGWGPGCSREHD